MAEKACGRAKNEHAFLENAIFQTAIQMQLKRTSVKPVAPMTTKFSMATCLVAAPSPICGDSPSANCDQDASFAADRSCGG